MNPGAFKLSLDESVNFLKRMKLFKSLGVKKVGEHSEESKKVAKSNDHRAIHSTAIQNMDYEVLLFDDSIFQFANEGGKLRFAFIQNPQYFLTKEQFLNEIYPPDELIDCSQEEIDELLNQISDEEYEQFLNEQALNSTSSIFRYDLDDNGYSPLIHSYSHIHIGLNEDLRIPCSKIITPLKFVLFSVKYTYYKKWKNALSDDPDMPDYILRSKNLCANLPRLWDDSETNELYLS